MQEFTLSENRNILITIHTLTPLVDWSYRGGVIISTHVIILTHDWSFLRGLIAIDKVNECIPLFQKMAHDSVSIGENSFIGAGAVILPGSKIGKLCIIGSGAVIKGEIPDYSVVVGNPCKIINDTRKYGDKIINKIHEL